MQPIRCAVAALCLVIGFAAVSYAAPPPVDRVLKSAISPEDLQQRMDRYVPVDLGLTGRTVDKALVPMLRPLRRAADRIDRVFWRQYSGDAYDTHQALRKSSVKGARQLARFLGIQYGPWDWRAGDEPFIGRTPRPQGAQFYPADMSIRELDTWTSKHPGTMSAIWSPYTVVRRESGGIVSRPYSKVYADDLAVAGRALKDAASAYKCSGEACKCAGFARFLAARADSFGSNEYRSSELLWLDTGDCPLDAAIGPYEVYNDRLMGIKTSFEAIIYYKDGGESRRYARLLEHHAGLVANLPVSDVTRNRLRAVKPSPITIADVLYTAGDARAGNQIRAFVLPNDETVRRARGMKHVILRNVARAKFDKLIRPLAERIFAPEVAAKVSFDAYFDFLLAWNMAHGVVPDKVELPGGAVTSPRKQLLNRHTFVDGVRGEVVALLNVLYLKEAKALRAPDPVGIVATYLASLFDAVRLGERSPQAVAKIITYGYLAREWVFRYTPRTRKLEVNPPSLQPAVMKLTAEVLEVLTRGDFDGAGRLIVGHGIMPPEMRSLLAGLGDLPVDILPRYVSVPGASE